MLNATQDVNSPRLNIGVLVPKALEWNPDLDLIAVGNESAF
jgi:hypothetical protein